MSQVSPAQAVGQRMPAPALPRPCLQQTSPTISYPASTDTKTVTNTILREGSTKAISLYKASESGYSIALLWAQMFNSELLFATISFASFG